MVEKFVLIVVMKSKNRLTKVKRCGIITYNQKGECTYEGSSKEDSSRSVECKVKR